jgi:hypothetical protein
LFRASTLMLFWVIFFYYFLNMAVPCKPVLFNFFYNCLVQSNLLSYSYIWNPFLFDILEDLLIASISVASTHFLLFCVGLHVSEPYNILLLISAL